AGQVFPEYIRRLRIRSGIKAFHPDAPQRVLDMPDGVLGLERVSLDGEQRVFAIHNMTGELNSVDVSSLGGSDTRWFDALHQVVPDMDEHGVRFRPYQTVWLMAKE
ncbi:MAG: hypothetical protein MI756_05805, partial [Chromatiales bacterium]|nr:hypothetical protein [Chromatiales bacterium]